MKRAASLARRFANPASIVFVLTAYVFFGSGGTWEFRRVAWADAYYASLAEGFSRGQLGMRHTPDAALAALPDPYVMEAREGIPHLWDASYFKGRYFLYFSPLPAIVFYMPFRLLTGGYPSEALAVTLFSAWSFLASVAVARRALRETRLRIPLWLWILLIGVGNMVPVVIAEVRVYQVAGAFGMAWTAMWAYALLRFFESPSWRKALLMGLYLSMAIATRPNVLVLLAIAGVAIVTALGRRRATLVAGGAMLAPIVVAGVLYGVYNERRFGSPFETGMTYQLTTTPMRDQVPCSLCSPAEVGRFLNHLMHYAFWPPTADSKSPYVRLPYSQLDKAVTFPAKSEQVGGIVPVSPLTMLAPVFMIVALRLRDPATRAGVFLTAAGWIVLFALSTCKWVTARYALDFTGLLMVGTVLLLERGMTFMADNGLKTRPLQITCVVLAAYSIVIGISLGFSGFERLTQ